MSFWNNFLESIFSTKQLEEWNTYGTRVLLLTGGAIGLGVGLITKDLVPTDYQIVFLSSTTGLGALTGYEIGKLGMVSNIKLDMPINIQGQYYSDGTKTGYPKSWQEGENKFAVDMWNRESFSQKYDTDVAWNYSGQKGHPNYIDNFMSESDQLLWERAKKTVDFQNGTASNVGQIAGTLSHSRAPWVGKAFFEVHDPHGTGKSDGAWQERWHLLDWYGKDVPNKPKAINSKGEKLWCNKPLGTGGGDCYGGGNCDKGMWSAGVFAPCYSKTNWEYPVCTVPILGAKPACPSLTKSPYPFKTVASDGSNWK